jgi:hypothetical protein
VLADKLPGAGTSTIVGFADGQLNAHSTVHQRPLSTRRKQTWTEGGRFGSTEAWSPGGRELVNPLLALSPFGYRARPVVKREQITRVLSSRFEGLYAKPGNSGSPMINVDCGVVTAMLSGFTSGGRRGYASEGVPLALIVRDLAKRADGMSGQGR